MGRRRDYYGYTDESNPVAELAGCLFLIAGLVVLVTFLWFNTAVFDFVKPKVEDVLNGSSPAPTVQVDTTPEPSMRGM